MNSAFVFFFCVYGSVLFYTAHFGVLASDLGRVFLIKFLLVFVLVSDLQTLLSKNFLLIFLFMGLSLYDRLMEIGDHPTNARRENIKDFYCFVSSQSFVYIIIFIIMIIVQMLYRSGSLCLCRTQKKSQQFSLIVS